MILEEYIFTSCFLNDIQGLIEQKSSRVISMIQRNTSLYNLTSFV